MSIPAEFPSDEHYPVEGDAISEVSVQPELVDVPKLVPVPPLGKAAVASEVLIISDEHDEAKSLYGDIFISTDTVGDYLKQVAKHPLINAAREVELARNIEVGLFANERRDIEESSLSKRELLGFKKEHSELRELERIGAQSKRELTNANLRLVVSYAKSYQGKGVEFIDLIQEGNKGLIEAVEKFDFAKGFKFSTYATYWIRRRMQTALADIGTEIRVPLQETAIFVSIYKAQRELLLDLGREPTDEEVAKGVDMTIEKYKKTVSFMRGPSLPLNAQIEEDGSVEFGDLIADDTAVDPELAADKSMISRDVEELLGHLNEADRELVRLMYGVGIEAPLSVVAIASQMGVTQSAIRQRRDRILGMLTELSSPELREYLS